MYQSYFPVCYYPTRIIFIDDQENFIDSTSLLLKSYMLKTFTNPVDALEFINREVKKQFSIARMYEEINVQSKYDLYTWQEFQANLLAALAKPHNEEYSVVICDYQMPLLDGFELFENIHSHYLERILLTGEADFAKAVGAFNKGLINFYIRKDNSEIATELMQLLETATWQYFNKFNAIDAQPEDSFSFLYDPVLAQYFKTLMKEKRIMEMYLWHYHGDLLVINARGEKSIISIRNQQALDESVELVYQDYLEEPSEALDELLKALKAGEKIISFIDETDEDATPQVFPVFKTLNTDQQTYYFFEQPFYQIGK